MTLNEIIVCDKTWHNFLDLQTKQKESNYERPTTVSQIYLFSVHNNSLINSKIIVHSLSRCVLIEQSFVHEVVNVYEFSSCVEIKIQTKTVKSWYYLQTNKNIRPEVKHSNTFLAYSVFSILSCGKVALCSTPPQVRGLKLLL